MSLLRERITVSLRVNVLERKEKTEKIVSWPHKAVSFVIGRDKEVQEWKEQQMPKAVLGFSQGEVKR